jgi:aspartate-semialdehyde dehydrogenase
MTMDEGLFFREKIAVGILGATGSVGQRFVELLATHPWFYISALGASERSIEKPYKDVVNWVMPTPLDPGIGEMMVSPCKPDLPCSIVFSALDASVAGEIETRFAEAGYIVISNSRNHRMDPDVPLLIPEVNGDHLELLARQKFPKGKIITNPNCSAIPLSLALKPLMISFGVERVNIVTLQAVSGAGYPGVPSLDILDNVIPYIEGEEEKLEKEPLKILGNLKGGMVVPCDFKISAQCNRVPVVDGHTQSVSVKFKVKPTMEDLKMIWSEFQAEPQALELPSAPNFPIYYFEEKNLPQPRLQRHLGKGMSISIGRLRECPIFDYKFTILSHNTIRGAAGGAILNAEYIVKKGHVFW